MESRLDFISFAKRAAAMGTKQLRITDPDLVKTSIGNFIGKNITVVLSDNTVMAGELKAKDNNEIHLTNMRRRKVRFPFAQITEIYVDTKVAC